MTLRLDQGADLRSDLSTSPARDVLTGLYENMPRGIIALVSRCKITGGHLATNPEVTAFRRAHQTDIRQLTSEACAVRLLEALREGPASDPGLHAKRA